MVFQTNFEQQPIFTERTKMEPITEAHAKELCEFFSDETLHQFVPFEAPSFEQQLERCARWAKRISPDGTELWLNWAARDNTTGQIAAHIQVGVKADSIASIGYVVGRRFQRTGIATECLRETFKYLCESLQVIEVKAWSDTRNEASHRLAKKLGMVQVDLIKDADFFKGSIQTNFCVNLAEVNTAIKKPTKLLTSRLDHLCQKNYNKNEIERIMCRTF